MGKRGRILVVSVAIVVLGVVGWSIFHASSAPPEPMYKGKPLSYWLQGYVIASGPSATTHANTAVRAAGTNAIPLLLRMLQTQDSPTENKLVAWAFSIPYVREHYTRPFDESFQAWQGFRDLGIIAAPAIPDLIKILNENTNTTTVEYSAAILGGLGPAASNAVPTLLRIATGTNQAARDAALGALGQIHCHPDTVVPLLVAALHDPSAQIRDEAASALIGFGADAKPAVPALVTIISEPDRGSNSLMAYPSLPLDLNTIVRRTAEKALQKIDPESYARVVTNAAAMR